MKSWLFEQINKISPGLVAKLIGVWTQHTKVVGWVLCQDTYRKPPKNAYGSGTAGRCHTVTPTPHFLSLKSILKKTLQDGLKNPNITNIRNDKGTSI